MAVFYCLLYNTEYNLFESLSKQTQRLSSTGFFAVWVTLWLCGVALTDHSNKVHRKKTWSEESCLIVWSWIQIVKIHFNKYIFYIFGILLTCLSKATYNRSFLSNRRLRVLFGGTDGTYVVVGVELVTIGLTTVLSIK